MYVCIAPPLVHSAIITSSWPPIYTVYTESIEHDFCRPWGVDMSWNVPCAEGPSSECLEFLILKPSQGVFFWDQKPTIKSSVLGPYGTVDRHLRDSVYMMVYACRGTTLPEPPSAAPFWALCQISKPK